MGRYLCKAVITFEINFDPAVLFCIATEEGVWGVTGSNYDPNASHNVEHQGELNQEVEHEANVVTDVLFKVFSCLFNQVVKLLLRPSDFHVPEKFEFVNGREAAKILECDETRHEAEHVEDKVTLDVSIGNLFVGDLFAWVGLSIGNEVEGNIKQNHNVEDEFQRVAILRVWTSECNLVGHQKVRDQHHRVCDHVPVQLDSTVLGDNVPTEADQLLFRPRFVTQRLHHFERLDHPNTEANCRPVM